MVGSTVNEVEEISLYSIFSKKKEVTLQGVSIPPQTNSECYSKFKLIGFELKTVFAMEFNYF